MATDILNHFVVSGCSKGLLKFWAFKENGKTNRTSCSYSIIKYEFQFKIAVKQPISTLKLSGGVALMRNHRESAMVAVALDNFTVSLVDIDTKTIVRKFEGHTSKINDATFSPDSRWLITAAMDSTIKVWDIPSSYMIDHFKTERPCISLSMSPTGDFLATAHVNFLGIYLWANKTLFNQVTLRSINPYADAPYVNLPSNACDELTLETALADMSMDVDEDEGEEINAKYETPTQLSTELITMSGLAESRWQNLLDLETIKQHNKPKAPPKVPKQAPFFLPTLAGPELKFDLASSVPETENSRVLVPKSFNNLTTFGKLLETTAETGEFEASIEHIKQLSPSMIDFEIKSLHPLGGGTYLAMVQFLKMIGCMFSTNTNFELSQSYLSVYLRAHGLSLKDNPEIIAAMKIVSQAQEKSWERIEKKLMYGIGVVAALRNFAH